MQDICLRQLQIFEEALTCDYRPNLHCTLIEEQLTEDRPADFAACCKQENRRERREAFSAGNADGRCSRFSCDEIISRGKTSLAIFWLKARSLTDLDNLPEPEALAAESTEGPESELENFSELAVKLGRQQSIQLP